jgi:hypothetical protein
MYYQPIFWNHDGVEYSVDPSGLWDLDDDNKGRKVWEVLGMTAEKRDEIHDLFTLVELRFERNKLLSESDWTQNPDVPQATKDKWADYRQQLRDITNNYTSLEDVVWPEKPL